MKMNIDDWINQVKKSKTRIAIPLLSQMGVEIIGEKMINAVKNGNIQYKAIKALADTFPSSAVTMFMDLSVEAEAFGIETRYTENEVPTILSSGLRSEDFIRKLEIPSLETNRIPEYLEAASLTVENISDKPVFAGCIGPFSLAARIYDVTEVMTAVLIEPEVIKLLLEKCTDFLISYCNAYKSTGAAGIIMSEPVSGMLSPELCYLFSSVYIKKIVENVQDKNFIIILHNCGNTNPLLKEMQLTGAKGFHFGNKSDIIKTLECINDDRLVMGNIDPVSVFRFGTSETVTNVTTGLLEKTSSYSNYILSSGCDLPPGIPSENIRAFYSELEEYNNNLVT